MFPPPGLLSRGPDPAREYLARVGEAGIDHVCCGDHVSFFGLGFDGLLQATALAMLHPVLPVHLGGYLLPLRHPVLVVRQLLDGGAVSFRGTFFDLDEAVQRAGRLGDGWLGIWNSPERFAAATALAAEEAARTARSCPPSRHAMQVWCGLADSRQAARACVAPVMEAFYQVAFERFERYCPYGTADDVAEFLTRYVAAGCTEFNLIPQSPDEDQAVAGVAAVKKLLARS